MILIDAANVSGGGAVLLQYLVDQLAERNVPFFVLKKPGSSLHVADGQVANGDASLRNRGNYLKFHLNRIQPQTLVCFGNFPPPFRTSVRTITYFHNPHYVNGYDSRAFTWRQQMSRYLRRLYLQLFQHNSDEFVVQTPFIANAFRETFSSWRGHLHILPFYDEKRIQQIRHDLSGIQKQPQSFLYASSSEPHKNHVNLLRCWEILCHKGVRPTLYLTVSPNSPYTTPDLLHQIHHLQELKANVINLGTVPYSDLLRYTAESSFCIFPSLNETLGLGLVEAYWMNNRVLIGQRPYVQDVIVPSSSFDPLDPADMARVVIQNMQEETPLPKLVIQNKINEFISALQS